MSGAQRKLRKSISPKPGILFLREETDIEAIIGVDPPNLITITDQKLYDRMLAGVVDRMAKNPEQVVKGNQRCKRRRK